MGSHTHGGQVQRLDVAGRLAAGIDDPRDPARTVHSVADILRFRMLLIAAGYEDGIDANALRHDPVFKLALERLPGERDLSSQSTISRLENLPDRRMLLKMARSPRRPAGRLRFANRIDRLLTVDGWALLRLLRASAEADHAGHRRYVRCRAWRTAAAVVQRALRRLRFPADRRVRRCRAVRSRRAAPGQASERSRDCRAFTAADPRDPKPLAACGNPPEWRKLLLRTRGARFLPRSRRGLHSRPRQQRHLASTDRYPRAVHHRPRRSEQRHQGPPLQGISRRRRIMEPGRAHRRRVEAGPQGCDTRFIVTNLTRGSGKAIYEKLYCARGQAENHIKA